MQRMRPCRRRREQHLERRVPRRLVVVGVVHLVEEVEELHQAVAVHIPIASMQEKVRVSRHM